MLLKNIYKAMEVSKLRCPDQHAVNKYLYSNISYDACFQNAEGILPGRFPAQE